RFLRMLDVVAMNATFNFGEDFYMDANKTMIYHITGNNRAVVTYSNADIKGFRFSPSDVNYLVAVLPGAKVGVFSDKDFDRLNLDELRKNGEFEFPMKASNQTVKNAKDLRKILGV
ncbi:MAG: hypothetical protein AAF570_00555, partial [Bacteroidota bacterium]